MKRSINELNDLYQRGENVDSELFAEQRSNVLLTSGNHYGKKLRDVLARHTSTINKDQKVRIVRNHIKKITTIYQNNILSHSPGVSIKAKNEAELQDQKVAELATSIWADWRDRNDFKAKISRFAQDYIDIGECVVKVFFDPNAGKFLGYDTEVDAMGVPVLGEDGQPVAKPKFEGDVIVERVLPFNLIRDPEAKAWDECRWVCVRKMVDTETLKQMVGDDPALLKLVSTSSKNTYQVFDGQTTSFTGTENRSQTLTREFYFKPSQVYPEGYFYICTDDGILFEGTLPKARWPFHIIGFDEFPTTCRCFSIIKQLRPIQAEINRAASSIVQTQLTLGMDKIILRNGSSMEAGGEAHGVKAIQVVGQDPTILSGRNGEQFVGYLSDCISELYNVAMIQEEEAGAENGQVDPYGMLFRTIKDKKKLVKWTNKFEDFLVQVCKSVLTLSRDYYTPDRLVPMVGKNEAVNIAEWSNASELCYSIIAESSSEDVESKMGRTLALNHILQYGGGNMAPEDLGKVLRLMPYVNNEKMFDEFTLNYDVANNILLRLDRGEYVPAKPNQDHVYIIKRLDHRMMSPDFDFLNPQIQQLYAQVKQEHDQMEAQRQMQIQQAKDGYIPSGGMWVACDFYLPPDPSKPEKLPKRARLPFEALTWLVQRLEAQSGGMSLDQLAGSAESVAREMNQMGQNPQGMMPPGQQQGVQ